MVVESLCWSIIPEFILLFSRKAAQHNNSNGGGNGFASNAAFLAAARLILLLLSLSRVLRRLLRCVPTAFYLKSIGARFW